jgi:hypothetical protein
MTDEAQSKRQEELRSIRSDLGELASFKHLFDLKHYLPLKGKPAHVKEAEAMYHRYEQKLKQFDDIKEELDGVDLELQLIEQKLEN